MTVALGVAAHGIAGGGSPSGSGAAFLVVVGLAVGALAALPQPAFRHGQQRASRQVLGTYGGLVLGQAAAHVALVVSEPHEALHGHSIVPSASMLGFHLAASAVAAVLLAVAEALYGPITSIVRAVLDPPLPRPDAPARLVPASRGTVVDVFRAGISISRRGPPVAV